MREQKSCRLCPRDCGVDRSQKTGFCGMTDQVKVARAALHYWEEPCFSGVRGSGTVFFSGCAMHCVFCQNEQIANGYAGKVVSVERLAQIYLELQEKGANNINLVTAGHYIPQVAESLRLAKEQGLVLPVLYNSSGYEAVSALEQLDGLVDIYLPDFKYWEPDTAARYAWAPEYPAVVKAAIREMVRQTGSPVFGEDPADSEADESKESHSHLMKKGVLVRHLILPGHVKEAKAIVSYLLETYGEQIYISMMNQYTPMPEIAQKGFPELGRKVTKREYERVLSYCLDQGLTQGFFQEGETAEESFIPAFDGYGV